ncbi:hypothetical protein KM043_012306 [Ampulex compressa]|nr:hypothetical protein KM043_012306 [Ampulex compressa]
MRATVESGRSMSNRTFLFLSASARHGPAKYERRVGCGPPSNFLACPNGLPDGGELQKSYTRAHQQLDKSADDPSNVARIRPIRTCQTYHQVYTLSAISFKRVATLNARM